MDGQAKTDLVSPQPAHSQSETNYVPTAADPTCRCALCEHYLGAGMCEMVQTTPDPINDDGTCDLFTLDEDNNVSQSQLDMQMSDEELLHEQASGSGFIYLPLNWLWSVVRIQDAMWQIFGCDDWKMQDTGTLHITLAYCNDISDEQMFEAAKAVLGMAQMPISLNGVGTFKTPDGQAVYLTVGDNPDLIAMQQAVFKALKAQGVTLSPFSNPKQYKPHVTIATAPTKAVIPPSDGVSVDTWASQVVFGRDNYQPVITVQLAMPEIQPSIIDALGPVTEMADWKVGLDTELPIESGDSTWDGAAAAKSVFDAAHFGTDDPDLKLVRQAFALYNASAPKLKSSYKLPVAKAVDGKLVAVKAGIRNARSRAPQVKGVAQATVDSAVRAIAKLEKKAGIGEMDSKRQEIRLMMVSELRGNYPNIPLPKDINLENLKAAIPGGVVEFVTLPIGQIDARSANQRTYTEQAVKDLVKQVNERRPEGMWGHLSADEMATRYDKPSIRWMAAMLDGDGVAWGKGLPLDEQTRDYYRIARATNARVGTSLTAFAEMEGDRVQNIDLKTIDIADPGRVGVPITAALPQLSNEMGDVRTHLHEMTDGEAASDAEVESPPVQEQSKDADGEVLETQQKEEKDMPEIAELTQQNAALQEQVTTLTEEKTTLTNSNTQLREQVGQLLKEYVNAAVDKAVSVAEARPIIARFVAIERPESKEAIDTALNKVLEQEDVKSMLKSMLASSLGPKTPESRDINKGNSTLTPIWDTGSPAEPVQQQREAV